jgi:hypothetical protein
LVKQNLKENKYQKKIITMIKTKSKWIIIFAGALAALISRLIILKIIPLRSSLTFQMDYSIIAKSFGFIPVAAVIVIICYFIIAFVLTNIGERISTGGTNRVIHFSLIYSLFWFIGVLETVAALEKPLLPEVLIGISDIIPLIFMGVIISILMPYQKSGSLHKVPAYRAYMFAIITGLYVLGRYFAYTIIHINSGYLVRAEATFIWTLAMGISISLLYCYFRSGLKGKRPLSRSLFFGIVVYGILWTLFNFFMPLLFDISFVKFNPPIMNYVLRVSIDIIFVIIAVYITENLELKQKMR